MKPLQERLRSKVSTFISFARYECTKLGTKFLYSPSEEVGGEDEASEETNKEALL